MKNYNRLIILALSLLMLNACDQNYIDNISNVDPGADQSAPVVTFNSPTEGYEIKLPEEISSVTIDFEVTDDIEVGDISVSFDGTQIASYQQGSYKDYRRALESVVYDNVELGDHVISITASDLEGKSTTKSINISKVSPYTQKYDSEVFYMPFEGDYMEMISFQTAGVVGSPGFGTDGLQNSKAYAGAADSYLTFPMDNFKFSEFTIGLWVKINASPGNAGILTVGTTDDDAGRKNGFRLFREGSASSMRIKLNVGVGSGESWNDGDVIDTRSGEWVYVAFSVTPTENTIYIDGVPVRTAAMSGPIDWTGCTNISIGSGDPSFTYWNHLSDLSHYDNIRIFNRALTSEEIQTVINDDKPYVPKYDGEILYMPFDGNGMDRISMTSAATVGSPTYVAGKVGQAYQGAADSYLSFPSAEIATGSEFSASFWLKIDASDTRAGILSIAPLEPSNPSDKPSGFGFIREGSSTSQKFLMLVGNGTNATWFNPGDPATIDPTVQTDWIHFAISISANEAAFYMNGVQVSLGAFTGIDWTGVGDLSIMSGQPDFAGWNHKAEKGQMDELRIFNKALTQEEVTTIMNDDM